MRDPDRLLPPLDALAESLLGVAAIGLLEEALAEAQAKLEREPIDPEGLLRYRLVFFDLAVASSGRVDVPIRCAVDLLAAALVVGEWGWVSIRSNRLTEIEQLALATEDGVELLELLAYAPDVDVRQFAVSGLSSAGMRALGNGADSRQFERLLHGVGATVEAYRLEGARKLHRTKATSRSERSQMSAPKPVHRVIAIAGGHARMRRTAASLLEPHGMTVVSIPSSREAVRRAHDILQVLRGCDAVVLVVRQITHSTSDQVRKTAERLGIPVIFSDAVSGLALERQLIESDGIRTSDA